MDFTSFKKIAKNLPTYQSVFIRGNHGIGKSQAVEQIADELDLPLIQRRLSQITEGDMVGLPEKKERYSTFLPMEWFAKCMENPHLIFLDEIDRAINEVIQASFELVYDRTIQGNKIHDGCRIFIAGNSGENQSLAYQVSNLDPAFIDRLWVADFSPSVDEWLSWATQNKVLPQIRYFIYEEPDFLDPDETNDLLPNKIYPTRRSWARLSDAIKLRSDLLLAIKEKTFSKKTKSDFQNLCCGFIGVNASSAFIDFITRKENITHNDVIENFDKISYKLKDSPIEVIGRLIEKISKDAEKHRYQEYQNENIFKFFKSIPDEYKIAMNEAMTRTEVHQINSQEFLRRARIILAKLFR